MFGLPDNQSISTGAQAGSPAGFYGDIPGAAQAIASLPANILKAIPGALGVGPRPASGGLPASNPVVPTQPAQKIDGGGVAGKPPGDKGASKAGLPGSAQVVQPAAPGRIPEHSFLYRPPNDWPHAVNTFGPFGGG